MTIPQYPNKDGRPNGRLNSKFQTKLTADARFYAAGRLAVGIPAAAVADEIQVKFNISITGGRIGQLTATNKAVKEYYDVCHKQFLEERAKYITDIAIGVKEERIKDAEIIRKQLFKMMNKLDKKVDEVVDKPDALNQRSAMRLMKELRSTIETHLKCLQFAHNESKQDAKALRQAGQPSLVQHVKTMQQVVQVKQSDILTIPTIGGVGNGEAEKTVT